MNRIASAVTAATAAGLAAAAAAGFVSAQGIWPIPGLPPQTDPAPSQGAAVANPAPAVPGGPPLAQEPGR